MAHPHAPDRIHPGLLDRLWKPASFLLRVGNLSSDCGALKMLGECLCHRPCQRDCDRFRIWVLASWNHVENHFHCSAYALDCNALHYASVPMTRAPRCARGELRRLCVLRACGTGRGPEPTAAPRIGKARGHHPAARASFAPLRRGLSFLEPIAPIRNLLCCGRTPSHCPSAPMILPRGVPQYPFGPATERGFF